MSHEQGRADSILWLGIVSDRIEARSKLRTSGDTVVIQRNTPRWLIIRCPDGCGDELSLNLDLRVGKAWRLYERGGRLSLYPSVWRTEGCQSHFIVWNSRILWLGLEDSERVDSTLIQTVRKLLSDRTGFVDYEHLAAELNEIPWAVLFAARELANAGEAEEGRGKRRGWFRSKLSRTKRKFSSSSEEQ